MTVYCYRCGEPIEVQPKVKNIELWTSGRARVLFAEEIVEHQCPQDAR